MCTSGECTPADSITHIKLGAVDHERGRAPAETLLTSLQPTSHPSQQSLSVVQSRVVRKTSHTGDSKIKDQFSAGAGPPLNTATRPRQYLLTHQSVHTTLRATSCYPDEYLVVQRGGSLTLVWYNMRWIIFLSEVKLFHAESDTSIPRQKDLWI